MRERLTHLYAWLAAANAGAWAWAVCLFHAQPVMLGTALLAYGLGMRHAVDADHIAAIDNVTRKLMQDGQRPLTVGLWFAIGHSTIILLAVIGIVLTTHAVGNVGALREIGAAVATISSTVFLFAVAATNLLILRRLWSTFNHVRAGGAYEPEDLDALLSGRGLLARVFRPLLALARRSWHMAPIGFLFGLGFDTASEVAVMGLSASHAASGDALASILVFPALFAAGMALIDTTDGVLMLGAYDWAFVKPIRKLYYNLTITSISALVAIVIGGIEALALIAQRFQLDGWPWRGIVDLSGRFNGLGFAIVALFIVCWLISFAIYRCSGLHQLDAQRT